MRRTRSLPLALALLLLAAGSIFAQERPPVPPDTVTAAAPVTERADTVADMARLPSPAGAMIRSFLVPGWGQSTYGAYVRGGVFFAAQTGSWFMVIKSMARLGEARDVEARIVDVTRDRLTRSFLEDTARGDFFAQNPDSLAREVERALDEDEDVVAIRSLVESREQQREDWIALVIFFTLASGVDAFVNAHLSDFPGDVRVTPRPEGGFTVGVHLPLSRSP